MSRRFKNGVVHRPADAHACRDMCVDAIADMDMWALSQLICKYHATTQMVADAIAQTERTAAEVEAAFTAWTKDPKSPRLSPKHLGRMATALAQPALPLIDWSNLK